MSPAESRPTHATEPVDDERLWSWVDRDAPELDAHLASHPNDRSRVDSIRRAIRAIAGEEVVDRTPESIGGYQIVRRVGSGGMGVVFEAEQARPKRRVALKVIRGAWLDDVHTRRLFYREAEVLARLNHPGIAQIFEAGETKEGAPFFVMELVEGAPLDRWARGEGQRARPSFERRMRVFEAICRAVQHAHEKGVVHRDLKPSNVLVEDGDRPKVLDFGLARIVDLDASLSLTAAVTGRVVGTVRYMSPEQARGLASRATATSDVYSLGVLLYELLTGRLPHDFEGDSIYEAARKVIEEPIALPSAVLERGDAAFAPAFDALAMQALAKEPGERYASALDLADDVRRALEGAPVSAPPPKARGRLEELGARAGRALGRAAQAAASSAAIAAREARAAAENGRPRHHMRKAMREARHASRLARIEARRAQRGAMWALQRVRDLAPDPGRDLLARFQRDRAHLHAAGVRLRAGLGRLGVGLKCTLVPLLALVFVVQFVRHSDSLTGLRARIARATAFEAHDTRAWIDRPLYVESAHRFGFPRAAPWDGVRWQGEQPVVRVLGEWYLLERIEGVKSTELIASIRANDATDWQAAFEERLCEHLYPSIGARAPDCALDLVVRRGPGTATISIEDLPAHEENVIALRRRRARESAR